MLADLRSATLPEDTGSGAVGAPSGFSTGDQVSDRFVVNGVLGRGSSGEVLSVRDLSLDRQVAMKVLRGAGGAAIARFMREARLTARIDHPNVPPVHMLEFLPDGGLLFTMRRLDGMSLGDCLRQQKAGGTTPSPVATTNSILQIMLRVCDALSRAHAMGIVHRDVKPDNIMLGQHGEVALVDWGECRLLSEPDSGPHGSTVGTPAYMSPEQARGESADQRSDVYALGATLYHMLTGQMPTWDDDPARFWDKKRAGELTPLAPAIERRIPRHLLAIARRALAARPADRYATAAELAADLDRFQAGLAVEAYREGSIELLARWLRRHRILLSAAAAVLAIAMVGAGLLWRERVRRLADWGEPVLVEDFADGNWRERWHEVDPASFEVRNGELVTVGPTRHFLMLKRPLSGAVAIEYDGRFLPDAPPGDLSVVWSEAPDALTNVEEIVGKGLYRGYWLQAGAFDNNFCAIYGRPQMTRLDKAPLHLDPARIHRFRVELDGRRLRMSIDGQPITEFEDLLPIGTGRLGFYGYYPGKAFSRVRVYQKRVAELQLATVVGDAFLDQKLYGQAAVAYQRVTESLPGTALAEEARYRQGLALRLDGQREASYAAWSVLAAPDPLARVALHRLDDRFRAGEQIAACDALASLHLANPSLRFLSRSTWQSWVDLNFQGLAQPLICEALMSTKERAFPDDPGSNQEYAYLLLRSGRHAEIPIRVPSEVTFYTWAMSKLGRTDELASRLPHFPLAMYVHDLARGTFGPPWKYRWAEDEVYCWQGQAAEGLLKRPTSERLRFWSTPPEEILAHDPTPGLRIASLVALDRLDEALAVPVAQADARLHDLTGLLAGRYDRSMLDVYPSPELHGRGMVDAAAEGDAALFKRMRAEVKRLWPDWERWLVWLIIEPSVVDPAERSALLRSRLEETWTHGRYNQAQRPWYVAGLALGRHDEAAMANMPARAEAPMWTAVGQALRAELAGDAAGVTAAWAAYRSLPARQRLSWHLVPDPGIERLATFKLTGK